ncbi:MAG TPA: hypothetical protein VEA59_06175 [Patescibacteria group bacterium]|nr:hypothetical protein [Patescibacteria group bacterium]
MRKKFTVLYVAGSVLMRVYVGSILTKRGYNVVAHKSIEEGREYLEQHDEEIDIVVCGCLEDDGKWVKELKERDKKVLVLHTTSVTGIPFVSTSIMARRGYAEQLPVTVSKMLAA